MNKPKWTPGPWESRESGAGVFGHVAITGSTGRTGWICELIAQGNGRYEYKVTNANAHLIASAPELYAFVQRQCEATNCICHLNALGGTDVSCTHCEAAALMAKARGETA